MGFINKANTKCVNYNRTKINNRITFIELVCLLWNWKPIHYFFSILKSLMLNWSMQFLRSWTHNVHAWWWWWRRRQRLSTNSPPCMHVTQPSTSFTRFVVVKCTKLKNKNETSVKNVFNDYSPNLPSSLCVCTKWKVFPGLREKRSEFIQRLVYFWAF